VDPLYEEFGKLVRGARERVRMSQADLGRRVRLSRTSVTNIERGRQHVSIRQLFDIARVLGLPPHTLLPEPRSVLPRVIRTDIKRKGYGEEVSGLIEQVWSSSAELHVVDEPPTNQGST